MENAKKYILVPEERLKQFAEEKLSELDQLMHDILKKKNLNDSEKATLYVQTLQKYVNFPFPTDKNIEQKNAPLSDKTTSSETVEKKVDPIEEAILKSVPIETTAITKNIIDFIRQHQSNVFWTPDKELVVQGKVIHNTNIVDLITHLIRNRKTYPKGHDIFYKELNEIDLPSNFIKNKYLKPKKTMYAQPFTWIS